MCYVLVSISFKYVSGKYINKRGLKYKNQYFFLKLRQYKNDSIQPKKLQALNLPRFFTHQHGGKKARQNQNIGNFFWQNWVVLEQFLPNRQKILVFSRFELWTSTWEAKHVPLPILVHASKVRTCRIYSTAKKACRDLLTSQACSNAFQYKWQSGWHTFRAVSWFGHSKEDEQSARLLWRHPALI